MSQIENGSCKELTVSRMIKISDFLKVDFFEIIGNSTHQTNINVTDNSSSFYGKHYNFSPDAIKSLAQETLLGMSHNATFKGFINKVILQNKDFIWANIVVNYLKYSFTCD